MVPTKWPLAQVAEVQYGKDGVATVRTTKGSYKRPEQACASGGFGLISEPLTLLIVSPHFKDRFVDLLNW